ncbi:hypothetical protein RV18_GL002567 [Enterococcus termitis]|nr:hypothetical protein RV18_GL002567 [Enterococcus termitis]
MLVLGNNSKNLNFLYFGRGYDMGDEVQDYNTIDYFLNVFKE